jgi:hypothetical protein
MTTIWHPTSPPTNSTISTKVKPKKIALTSPPICGPSKKLTGLRWVVVRRRGWSSWCVVDSFAPFGVHDVRCRFVVRDFAVDFACLLNDLELVDRV